MVRGAVCCLGMIVTFALGLYGCGGVNPSKAREDQRATEASRRARPEPAWVQARVDHGSSSTRAFPRTMQPARQR